MRILTVGDTIDLGPLGSPTIVGESEHQFLVEFQGERFHVPKPETKLPDPEPPFPDFAASIIPESEYQAYKARRDQQIKEWEDKERKRNSPTIVDPPRRLNLTD